MINLVRIFGVAYNYSDLDEKLGKTFEPLIFRKGLMTARGHPIYVRGENRTWPEVELAIRIGRDKSDPYGIYIAAIGVANDVTTRWSKNMAIHSFLGKETDSHCPIGMWRSPELLPLAEEMATLINGEVVQESHIGFMKLTTTQIVNKIQKTVRLNDGDIILTGTPAHSHTLLKPGDIVTCAIQGIGEITNPVEAYSAS
ncbi:MAG: fumarylacetoacetate hydrolase family protein [Planctomycetes bacterium]|nr:fumarylacetoacetate hydrolase family protein [Planctomycetota bacterium]